LFPAGFMARQSRGAQEYMKSSVCSTPSDQHMTVSQQLIRVWPLKRGTLPPTTGLSLWKWHCQNGSRFIDRS